MGPPDLVLTLKADLGTVLWARDGPRLVHSVRAEFDEIAEPPWFLFDCKTK